MSESTFEAASLEAALEQAAAALDVDAADLEHKVVEEKQDFWGGGNDTVVIKAWKRVVAEPTPEPEPEVVVEAVAAAPAPVEVSPEPVAEVAEEPAAPETAAEPTAPSAPAEAADTAPAAVAASAAPEKPAATDGDDAPGVEADEVTSLLAQIFHDMEFDCTIEIETEGDGYLATIAGTDKEPLLEGNGRCLSALELIANNAFRNKLPRGSKIRVDAGDFRSRRDQELGDLALQVAHSAKESGRTQETQPLNPYERRLVHLALAEDPTVTTRSRGSGFLKNVQVIPQDGGRQGRGQGRS